MQTDDHKKMNFSMRLSLFIGFFMLIIKTYAYSKTHSAAILSDASESIIHVLAVGFATYSMWLSLKPADQNHHYGHEKIGYFSAGFEGAMIVMAACYIFYESLRKIIYGFEINHIYAGMGYTLIAIIINLLLGVYLIQKGRKYQSIVLEANGKHILADSWTSISVIIALVLVHTTKIVFFDPLIAIIAGINILWTGLKLIRKSIGGLMDKASKEHSEKIKSALEEFVTKEKGLAFHHLRHRQSGNRLFIEFHLIFPRDLPLSKAHETASEIEAKIKHSLELIVDIVTHLEPREDHDFIHQKYGLPL